VYLNMEEAKQNIGRTPREVGDCYSLKYPNIAKKKGKRMAKKKQTKTRNAEKCWGEPRKGEKGGTHLGNKKKQLEFGGTAGFVGPGG